RGCEAQPIKLTGLLPLIKISPAPFFTRPAHFRSDRVTVGNSYGLPSSYHPPTPLTTTSTSGLVT
ncbi:hypothetical protein F2P79_025652, partial [Pimephales promelas]